MHELSLSYATVESVVESVAELEATRVISITLLAGELSGVLIEAFRFSFPIAAAGTILEDAALVIQNERVTIYCSGCNAIERLASIQSSCCPRCGQPSGDVRSGQDFTIQSIEIETDKELQHEHTHR